MCTTSEDKACYNYGRIKFSFRRCHNVFTPLVVLPGALLKTMAWSGLYYTTPIVSTLNLSKVVMFSCSFYRANKASLSDFLNRQKADVIFELVINSWTWLS